MKILMLLKQFQKLLGKEEEGKKRLEEHDKKIEEYKKEITMDKNQRYCLQ